MEPRPVFVVSATGLTDQCQRQGCSRTGGPRTDMVSKRTIFLCETCFSTLHAYQLRDLFRRFGVGGHQRKRRG